MNETTSAPFEKQRISRRNGRTIHFEGRLMCSTEFEAQNSPTTVVLELWEVETGQWIAATTFERDTEAGTRDTTHAVIIEMADEMTMQDNAMEFWEWEPRARSMVKKQLKWDLSVTLA